MGLKLLALGDGRQLIAFALALFGPVFMLVTFLIDKLGRADDDRLGASQRERDGQRLRSKSGA
jgi:hypothetical protein